MKVKCEKSVVMDSHVFNDLFSCLSAHRESHVLDISNIQELIELSGNNQDISLKLKALAVSSVNRNFEYTISVGTGAEEHEVVSVQHLNRELSRKSIVIIENEHSDSGFLDSVISAMKKKNLQDLKNISWEVKGAGGCGEIPKLIESESAKFGRNFRAVVIHDSDRMFPNQELNQIHKNIIDKCQDKNIECYTLEKREIENYIPDEIIEKIKPHSVELAKFKNLSTEQKDYFDYKRGFKQGGEMRKKDDPLFNGLYLTIDDETYGVVKNGFGKKIAEDVFVAESAIPMDAFKRRCGRIPTEFDMLCRAIERIL